MRIYRHYTELPADIRGGVVALGNFDGVHLGHQAVIGAAQAVARERSVACGVMSFEPHPRTVFRPNDPPFRLTSFRIKLRLVEALGVDFVLLQHFDLAFAAHSAVDFVDRILIQGLGISHVVVGYDYVFGHGRQGNVDVLRRLAAERGFGITCIGPVGEKDGLVYSSSRIRDALRVGHLRDAARMLGRPWEIEGRVEEGDRRGRQIGFPTANIELGEFLHPAFGVYAVRAGVDRSTATEWRDGVANFGLRPTFNKQTPLLEVHLLDFNGNLYGRHLRVSLVDFLRAERRFDGLESLKAQIQLDGQAARRSLAAYRDHDEQDDERG
jgi:riboflavin kinase/FMN adenylyltransferase